MRVEITRLADEQYYYGHGKLLITSEYFVLDGAKALALPTKFGQSLRVKKLHASSNILYWIALNNKKHNWLNLVFDTTDFTCINSNQEEAKRLTKILSAARNLNPEFLNDKQDTAVETFLGFPNKWGFGSSSTLIHCVAKWAEVNAYKLLKNTIGGSGYDVACAANDSAIIYQLQNSNPVTEVVKWNPNFKENIFFAFTGKKQLSSEGIKHYKNIAHNKVKLINQLNRITESILRCEDFIEFEKLIVQHETLVGESLQMTKVKENLFPDYWGSVKSLGAWGGDFVMLTNNKSNNELKEYLKQKNIDIVFKWNEIILATN